METVLSQFATITKEFKEQKHTRQAVASVKFPAGSRWIFSDRTALINMNSDRHDDHRGGHYDRRPPVFPVSVSMSVSPAFRNQTSVDGEQGDHTGK